jgi:cobalt-zinc-cadmium efflux system outer membrane protein
MRRVLALVALAIAVASAGCATSDRDRRWVEERLEERGVTSGDEDVERLVADGIDETEVSRIALARSPRFHAELARIDAARADLDEAARIANPQITLGGPLGPITAVAMILAPLESLWQLPARTEAATRALEATAESVVQTGLDVARDARLAHIELVLAGDRVALRREVLALVAELARIADARANVGEATSVEAALARAELGAATDALAAAGTAQAITRARLAEQLGIDPTEAELEARDTHEPVEPPSVGELLRAARASRPDVRGVELALRAATARGGWERTRVVALAAQVETQWSGDQVGVRLGGRIDLPIFSQNQGGIGRADAEVARLTAQLEATRLRVTTEVVESRARLVQARASLALYRADVLPALAEALRVATRTWEIGEDTYLFVLDALRRQVAARLVELDLLAEARRAEAELERAIGARLEAR